MRAKLKVQYRGDSQVAVHNGKAKEPHFVICGAQIGDLDIAEVNAYLNECDWTDRGSRGWITPQVRCDSFLTERAKRRASHGQDSD